MPDTKHFDGKVFYNPDSRRLPGLAQVLRWKLTSRPEPSPRWVPDVQPSVPPRRVEGSGVSRPMKWPKKMAMTPMWNRLLDRRRLSLDNNWLESLWTGIPVILVAVIFAWGFLGYLDMRQPPANSYEIRVLAKRWVWAFQYPNGHIDETVRQIREQIEAEKPELIAEGRTRRDIAGRLNISVKTFDTHRADLMAELDIHDVAGLVRFAQSAGLVERDE